VLSFGVVSGIRASCRSIHFPRVSLSESFGLRDKYLDHQNKKDKTVTWPGNSGAAVVDPKGRVARFIRGKLGYGGS
jgi:hypothetical protein